MTHDERKRHLGIGTAKSQEPKGNDNWLADDEAAKRRDAVLRVMLNTAEEPFQPA